MGVGGVEPVAGGQKHVIQVFVKHQNNHLNFFFSLSNISQIMLKFIFTFLVLWNTDYEIFQRNILKVF